MSGIFNPSTENSSFLQLSSSPFLLILSSSSVHGSPPLTVDAARRVSTGGVRVASRRRDWPWLGPLRPHCSSWQEHSWELFNSRRIGGSASHHYPPVHRHTHTCACAHHATAQPGRLCVSASDKTSLLPESTLQGRERCCGPQSLPNIQSGVDRGGKGEKCMNHNPRYCKSDPICTVNQAFACLDNTKTEVG